MKTCLLIVVITLLVYVPISIFVKNMPLVNSDILLIGWIAGVIVGNINQAIINKGK